MEKIRLTNFQIIGYLIPGFAFLVLVYFSYYGFKIYETLEVVLYDSKNEFHFYYGLAVLILAFCIGLILDSIRNGIVEEYLDDRKFVQKYNRKDISRKYNILSSNVEADDGIIDWDYFFSSKEENCARLYGKFYTYYVFDVNLMLVLIFIVIIFSVFRFIPSLFGTNFSDNYCTPVFFMLFTAFVLFLDARVLRKYIYIITKGYLKTEYPTKN